MDQKATRMHSCKIQPSTLDKSVGRELRLRLRLSFQFQKRQKRSTSRSRRRAQRGIVWSTASTAEEASHSGYGVWLEVDKVIVDAHTKVHRVAFNKAFQAVGQRSTKWTPEIFWQVLRSAAATPDSLIQTYYNTVGWPRSIAAKDHEKLVVEIQRKKDEALMEMVQNNEIPLREGVKHFIEDVLQGGASVALLASTCSSPREGLVEAALSILGPQIANRVRVFQCPQSGGPDERLPADDSSSLEQSFQNAAAKRKLEEAQAFMESVNRSKLGVDWKKKSAANDAGQLAQRPVGEGMMIDPGLLVSVQRFSSLSPAWLAACCATADFSLRQCALLSGTNSVLRAAQAAGMLAVAVPSSYSGRGIFTGADIVTDSFGSGGGVTWSRLSRSIDSRPAKRRSRM